MELRDRLARGKGESGRGGMRGEEKGRGEKGKGDKRRDEREERGRRKEWKEFRKIG